MNENTLITTKDLRIWWLRRRVKYNLGLLAAGFITFLLYNILGPIIIAPHEEFEETIFEIAFQGGVYFFAMGLANLFYTSGSIADLLFNKNNSQRFRERLFATTFWFSFALPILIILSVMIRFLIWGQ